MLWDTNQVAYRLWLPNLSVLPGTVFDVFFSTVVNKLIYIYIWPCFVILMYVLIRIYGGKVHEVRKNIFF